MESRHNARVDAPMGIGCYYGSAGWSSGRVRDISTDGAYIALASASFRSQTPITLVLDLYAAGNRVRLRWRAKIMRTDQDGIAVVFSEETSTIADSLYWVMQQFKQ